MHFHLYFFRDQIKIFIIFKRSNNYFTLIFILLIKKVKNTENAGHDSFNREVIFKNNRKVINIKKKEFLDI